jgi:hypothetical protein
MGFSRNYVFLNFRPWDLFCACVAGHPGKGAEPSPPPLHPLLLCSPGQAQVRKLEAQVRKLEAQVRKLEAQVRKPEAQIRKPGAQVGKPKAQVRKPEAQVRKNLRPR